MHSSATLLRRERLPKFRFHNDAEGNVFEVLLPQLPCWGNVKVPLPQLRSEENVFTKFRNSAVEVNVEVPLPQLHSWGNVRMGKFSFHNSAQKEISPQSSASTIPSALREWFYEVLFLKFRIGIMSSRSSASAIPLWGKVIAKFRFRNSALGGMCSSSSTNLKTFSCSLT